MFYISGAFTGSTELLLVMCMDTIRVQHFQNSAVARKSRAALGLLIITNFHDNRLVFSYFYFFDRQVSI